MGTRISIYYILVFLLLLVGGPIIALVMVEPEKLQAIAAGEAELGAGMQLLLQSVLMPAVVAVTVGFVHFVDKKPLSAIGAVWPPGEGGRVVGQLVAALLGAAGILASWWVGAGLFVSLETVSGVDPDVAPLVSGSGEVALWVLGFLASATLHEWILRGYIYSTLREQLSWVHSGGIASLLLVLLHVNNPDVTAPALISLFLRGLAMSAVREVTGSLWPVVVFETAWNVGLGMVLGLPVSGMRIPAFRVTNVEGPDTWTGGSYGPEASWLLVGLLLVALLVLASVLGEDEEAEEDDTGS